MRCIIMKVTNMIIFPIINQKHDPDYGINSIYRYVVSHKNLKRAST